MSLPGKGRKVRVVRQPEPVQEPIEAPPEREPEPVEPERESVKVGE